MLLHIANRKSLKTESLYSTFRNSVTFYYNAWSFGVLCSSRYLDIEAKSIISCNRNKHKWTFSKYNKRIIYYSKRNTFLSFVLRCVNLIIKPAKEKTITEKCIRTTEILINAMEEKEINERVNAHEKQLRSEYIDVMYALSLLFDDIV